jgi:hypothetical protein
MRRPSLLLGWTIYVLFCATISARGQSVAEESSFQKIANNFINEEIKRLPWEIGLNIVPVISPGMSVGITYPYIIRRNVGKGSRLGAWRFSTFPSFLSKVESVHPDTTIKFLNKRSNRFLPRIDVGYEWQKVKGRFVLIYGLGSNYAITSESESSNDHVFPFGKYEPERGKYEYTFRRNIITVAPILGAKIHFNKHFSISTESQLQTFFLWGKSATSFNGVFLQRNFEHDWFMWSYPVYAINLACHF